MTFNFRVSDSEADYLRSLGFDGWASWVEGRLWDDERRVSYSNPKPTWVSAEHVHEARSLLDRRLVQQKLFEE